MKRPRGLSLAELVVALCLIGLLLSSVLTAFPASQKLVVKSQIRMEAQVFAHEIVTNLRALPTDRWASSAGRQTRSVAGGTGRQEFAYQVRVVGNTDIRVAYVTIAWECYESKHSITTVTVMSKLGSRAAS